MRPQTIFVSATPAAYELKLTGGEIVEQVVRPTGLLDPQVVLRPVEGQVDDLLGEVRERAARGERVLVTTLTKRMAEELTEYFREVGVKVEYLHSDVETLERVRIISDLRRGEFDVLVGVNLLREGLDLPEVSLVGVLDADKEGYLRSETALIQTMGRAARNVNGTVILYADQQTPSIERAVAETRRRRAKQEAYNAKRSCGPGSPAISGSGFVGCRSHGDADASRSFIPKTCQPPKPRWSGCCISPRVIMVSPRPAGGCRMWPK